MRLQRKERECEHEEDHYGLLAEVRPCASHLECDLSCLLQLQNSKESQSDPSNHATPAWTWVRSLRLNLYQLINSRWFEWVIVGFILANSLVLLLTHDRMSPDFALVLEVSEPTVQPTLTTEHTYQVVNYVCTGAFTIEAAIKLSALGPNTYFRDSWCKFDFAVVVLSLLGLGVSGAGAGSALRALRLLRVVKLINKSPKLERLLGTLMLSLPALGNVLALLLLFIFIWGKAN